MGDPRRLKKKYETPAHPWRRENIETERVIKKEYALKNKRELWKMKSILKNFKDQAKKLIAAHTKHAEREKSQLMQRLERLGLIQHGAKLDDILSLTTKNILERRLQSIIYRKGLARTMSQSRQFIVHQHVAVGKTKITSPGHLVTKEEETSISFYPRSTLANPEHAERVPVEKITKKSKRSQKAEISQTEVKAEKVELKSQKAELSGKLGKSEISQTEQKVETSEQKTEKPVAEVA